MHEYVKDALYIVAGVYGALLVLGVLKRLSDFLLERYDPPRRIQ